MIAAVAAASQGTEARHVPGSGSAVRGARDGANTRVTRPARDHEGS